LFETLAFRGISGPNSLEGVITSKVIPSFSVSSINDTMRPTGGRSLFIASDISGLGGSVRMVRPVIEYKRFISMKGLRPRPLPEGRQVLGFRVLGSFLTGYGGRVAPPFERFYLGGDTDVRGFDIRSVTPYSFIVNRQTITLTNPDGSAVPVDPNNPRRGAVQIPLAVPQIVFTGGDTQVVANVEYRIPIAGDARFV
jgi:outer membrane protein insertion porin family